MDIGDAFVVFLLFLLALFVLITLARSVRIVPQARAGIVERLGRYHRTLNPGLTIVVPFVDRVLPLLDLREQVVSFPPQPVITEDNLVVSIDTVLYFSVTDPKAATYEIANYIQAIEQLTVTTLRNVIGGMDLERTLTSREEINNALRGVLDEATGRWGIRVNRVELKAIDPPPSIQDSMEKQMRADRDKRAAILTAEGARASQILTAEGEKQAAVLRAEGEKQAAILTAEADRQAKILRAHGEAQAVATVFDAIHRANPNQEVLSYQYMQMLPRLADGEANKVWIIPSEIGRALEGLGTLGDRLGMGADQRAAVTTEGRVREAAAPVEPQATSVAAREVSDREPADTPGISTPQHAQEEVRRSVEQVEQAVAASERAVAEAEREAEGMPDPGRPT